MPSRCRSTSRPGYLPVFEVSVEVHFLRLPNDSRQLAVDGLVHRCDRGDFGSNRYRSDERGGGGGRVRNCWSSRVVSTVGTYKTSNQH